MQVGWWIFPYLSSSLSPEARLISRSRDGPFLFLDCLMDAFSAFVAPRHGCSPLSCSFCSVSGYPSCRGWTDVVSWRCPPCHTQRQDAAAKLCLRSLLLFTYPELRVSRAVGSVRMECCRQPRGLHTRSCRLWLPPEDYSENGAGLHSVMKEYNCSCFVALELENDSPC